MDRIIEVKVGGNYITKDSKNAGVRGEANATCLRITFDEGWTGYSKKVTFWDAKGMNPVVIDLSIPPLNVLVDNTNIFVVPIPGEAMTEAGMLTFVIDGCVEGVRQRTISDRLMVKDAPISVDTEEPSPITPSQIDQLKLQIENILDEMHAEAVAADSAKKAAEEAQSVASSAAGFSEGALKQAQDNADYALEYAGEAKKARDSAASHNDDAKKAKEAAESARDDAKNAQSAIENLTASSEQLHEGDKLSVTKTVSNGIVNLHFGIPKGEKGEQGAQGLQGVQGEKGETFSYDDLTEEQKTDLVAKVVIDSTLTQEGTAADAYKVGKRIAISENNIRNITESTKIMLNATEKYNEETVNNYTSSSDTYILPYRKTGSLNWKIQIPKLSSETFDESDNNNWSTESGNYIFSKIDVSAIVGKSVKIYGCANSVPQYPMSFVVDEDRNILERYGTEKNTVYGYEQPENYTGTYSYVDAVSAVIPENAKYLYISGRWFASGGVVTVIANTKLEVECSEYKANEIYKYMQSPLWGKRLYADGDSICAGNGYAGGYGKIIADRYNMTLENRGVGGATLTNMGATTKVAYADELDWENNTYYLKLVGFDPIANKSVEGFAYPIDKNVYENGFGSYPPMYKLIDGELIEQSWGEELPTGQCFIKFDVPTYDNNTVTKWYRTWRYKNNDDTYSGHFWIWEAYKSGLKTYHESGEAEIATARHWLSDSVNNVNTDSDYFVFEGGINDYSMNRPIGVITDDMTSPVDTTTVIGAMEHICRRLLALCKGKRILYIITPKAKNYAHAPLSSSINGKTWTDYHDAIVSVLKKYSIPTVDLFSTSSFNTELAEYNEYTLNADGVHPTKEGYELFFVPQIVSVMESGVGIGSSMEVQNTASDSIDGEAIEEIVSPMIATVDAKTEAASAKAQEALDTTSVPDEIVLPVWEQGGYGTANGYKTVNSARIRTKDFINCKNATLEIIPDEGAQYNVYYFDENREFVKAISSAKDARTLEGGYYYKFAIGFTEGNAISPTDNIPVSITRKTTLVEHDIDLSDEINDVKEKAFTHSFRALFNKVVCIGDSMTRGYQADYNTLIEGDSTTGRNRDYSYPVALSRMTNLMCDNYGNSGATAISWYNRYSESDFSEYDCAIICLGRNPSPAEGDVSYTLGLESDADKTAYQNIINKLKSDNEHMTIFLLSLPARKTGANDADKTVNGRIQEIATTNNIPYIDIWKDTYTTEEFYYSDGVHYNTIGYMVMAQNILDNIEKYISEHQADFNLYSDRTMGYIIDHSYKPIQLYEKGGNLYFEDGTQVLTGSGEDNSWMNEPVLEIEIAEDTAKVLVDKDKDGNEFNYERCIFRFECLTGSHTAVGETRPCIQLYDVEYSYHGMAAQVASSYNTSNNYYTRAELYKTGEEWCLESSVTVNTTWLARMNAKYIFYTNPANTTYEEQKPIKKIAQLCILPFSGSFRAGTKMFIYGKPYKEVTE